MAGSLILVTDVLSDPFNKGTIEYASANACQQHWLPMSLATPLMGVSANSWQ